MTKLRPYQPSDTEAILALFYDTVQVVNRNDYSAEQLNAWVPPNPDIRKWQERLESSKTMVAESEGKLVGFGNLEHKKSIGMLYVHKDFQGQGVGSMLLNRLEGMLVKKEVKVARVEASLSSQSFFEQKGYQVVRENRKQLNGIEFKNFLMEKRLPLEEKKKDKQEKKSAKVKTKKKKSFPWGNLFINKVFDLLIVVAGISIAFQLETVKQESDQKALGRFYLASMIRDIDNDITKGTEVLRNLQSDYALLNGYLKKLEQPNPDVDSLGIVIVAVLDFETFRGNQDTYTTLLTSNGFNTLGDQEIQNQVTEYYKQYVSISRFEKVYTDLIYQLNAYFSPFCDYATQRVIDPTLATKVQTKNNFLLTGAQLNNGVEDYLEMISKAKALKTTIQSSLENSTQH